MLTESESKNSIIEQNADNVVHITCLDCSPRKGNLYLMFCGVWDTLTNGYYQEGKEIYCPICEDQGPLHNNC